jgi:actin related protein 2/3 complex subunit 3
VLILPFLPLLTVDIVDECLLLFRGNCFFRNFGIKGSADRTLIYEILFISGCLNKLATRPCQNQEEATRALINLALDDFSIPGEPRFPLKSLYEPPANQQDAGHHFGGLEVADCRLLRQYLTHFRQDITQRLVGKVYAGNPDTASKWWMLFRKRLFMNKSLS